MGTSCAITRKTYPSKRRYQAENSSSERLILSFGMIRLSTTRPTCAQADLPNRGESPNHGGSFTFVLLMRGGVGKTRAAASAPYAICTWQPDLYLVLGTAGAVDPVRQEGEVIWATRTVISDFRLALTSSATNTLVTDHAVVCPIDWSACPFPHVVSPGIIATGDGDVTAETAPWLHATFAATVADWESGAIAYVCALNAIPWLILRGVSDTPTMPPDQQYARYQHNTPVIMQQLWGLIPSVLHYAHQMQGLA
jgi:nucleoside phosphorylase